MKVSHNCKISAQYLKKLRQLGQNNRDMGLNSTIPKLKRCQKSTEQIKCEWTCICYRESVKPGNMRIS